MAQALFDDDDRSEPRRSATDAYETVLNREHTLPCLVIVAMPTATNEHLKGVVVLIRKEDGTLLGAAYDVVPAPPLPPSPPPTPRDD